MAPARTQKTILRESWINTIAKCLANWPLKTYLDAMPSTFDFCLPTRATTVPDGPDWLHEIKYDGYPYKRSHLIALRATKISASDPPSTWWRGFFCARLIRNGATRVLFVLVPQKLAGLSIDEMYPGASRNWGMPFQMLKKADRKK